MTIVINGINTASIIYNDKFCLMAVKVKTESDEHITFYMQPNVLVDLLVLMQNRAKQVAQQLVAKGDIYKAKILAENERLSINIPQFELNELQVPEQGYLVTSFAPKQGDGNCTLIAMLQNENILSLKIDDFQVDFISLGILKALHSINDKEALQFIGSVLDFLLLYYVDLSDLSYLNYKQVSHEPWKQSLFTNHIAVLYSFTTEQGEQLLSGTVIKANASADSDEVKSIIQRLALLAPELKAVQEKYPLCQTFTRIIPSEPDKVLTMDECLRPLHAFCLEMQNTLNK